MRRALLATVLLAGPLAALADSTVTLDTTAHGAGGNTWIRSTVDLASSNGVLTSPVFSTGGGRRMIVLAVMLDDNASTNPSLDAVAWTTTTPPGATAFTRLHLYTPQSTNAIDFWGAWTAEAVSSVSVTFTPGGTVTAAAELLDVYALVGAKHTATMSDSVGATMGAVGALATNITPTSAQSLILGGVLELYSAVALTATSAIGTYDDTWPSTYHRYAYGRVTTHGTGAVSFGSTTGTVAQTMEAAIEILPEIVSTQVASITAPASVSAALSVSVPLSASITGQATMTPEMAISSSSVALQANITAPASVSATLSVSHPLSASVAASATVAAGLSNPATPPTIRAGFPVIANHATAAAPYTITTAAFSANAGDVLVAFAQAYTLPVLQGSSLRWLPRVTTRNNDYAGGVGHRYQQTTMWTAVVPPGGVTGETVSFNVPTTQEWGYAVTDTPAQIQVFAFDNAGGVGYVRWRGAEGNLGVITAGMTMRARGGGSLLLAGGSLWGGAWGAGAGSSLAGAVTNSMGVLSRVSTGAGTFELNTDSTAQFFCFAGIEILPAGATPPTKRLLALGDSGVESNDSENPWAPLTTEALGTEWELYGGGVWWAYSEHVRARWTDMWSHAPPFDMVVYRVGWNDITYHGALNQTDWLSTLTSISTASPTGNRGYIAMSLKAESWYGYSAGSDAADAWMRSNAPAGTHFYAWDAALGTTTQVQACLSPDATHWSDVCNTQIANELVTEITSIMASPVLGASLSGTATVGATLSISTPSVALSASIDGQATVAGPLSAATPLSATISGQATLDCGMGACSGMGATVSGQSSITATLSVSTPLGAQLAGTAAVGAGASVATPLAATVDGRAAVDASLTGGSVTVLDAAVAGAGSVSADLSVTTPAGAAVAGTSSVAANLGVTTPAGAGIQGTASVAAELTITGNVALAADIQGQATVSAAAETQGSGLSAAIGGTSSVAATLSVSVPLGATLQGTSSVQAALPRDLAHAPRIKLSTPRPAITIQGR
jgi:hypothetical protein